jgi:hypothetical protein
MTVISLKKIAMGPVNNSRGFEAINMSFTVIPSVYDLYARVKE